MRYRISLLYPILFAAVPALHVAASNPGQYSLSDLVTVVVVVVAGVGLMGALVALVLRRWQPPPRAEQLGALITLFAVAGIFFTLPARDAVSAVSRPLAHSAAFAAAVLLASALAGVYLLRHPRAVASVGPGLTVAGALLVATSVVRIAVQRARGAQAISRSQLLRSLDEPIRIGPVAPGRNEPMRDIYLIILDGRANSAVLREHLGVSDDAFEDSLRALGFVLPREMRSNYGRTVVSVPSILNFEHVTRLTQDAGPHNDYTLPRHLTAENRAAKFLKARGYKYVFVPSTWYGMTAHSPLADVELDSHSGRSVRDALRRTELRRLLIQMTLLRKISWLQGNPNSELRAYLQAFEDLKQLAADPDPTFAFAHVLLPHPPFLFDSLCRSLTHPIVTGAERDTPKHRAGYASQLQCANRLVLDLVTSVLRRSQTPPIVLIVGDHGTQFTNAPNLGYWERPERASATFVRERFGAFGAFYAPAGGDSLFAGQVTLVNVMRHVLRYYFGAELPLAPDDQYMSGARATLYRFVRVTELGRTPERFDHSGRLTDQPARADARE